MRQDVAAFILLSITRAYAMIDGVLNEITLSAKRLASPTVVFVRCDIDAPEGASIGEVWLATEDGRKWVMREYDMIATGDTGRRVSMEIRVKEALE